MVLKRGVQITVHYNELNVRIPFHYPKIAVSIFPVIMFFYRNNVCLSHNAVALFTNQCLCIFPEPQSAMNVYEISYKSDSVSVTLQMNGVHLMKLYPPCI